MPCSVTKLRLLASNFHSVRVGLTHADQATEVCNSFISGAVIKALVIQQKTATTLLKICIKSRLATYRINF